MLDTLLLRHFIDIHFIIPLFGIITKLQTCILSKVEVSTSVFPFNTIIVLPFEGHLPAET